jgi:hypothetical protein
VDVDGHLGHPGPKDTVDGLDAFGFHLDMVTVEVEPGLVLADVMEVAIGIGLGDDEDVDPLEERLQIAEGDVPDEPEPGLLGGLLIAVLGCGQKQGRLLPVEGRRGGRPLPGQNAQEDIMGWVVFNVLRSSNDPDRHLFGRDIRETEELRDVLIPAISPVIRLLGGRLQVLGKGQA